MLDNRFVKVLLAELLHLFLPFLADLGRIIDTVVFEVRVDDLLRDLRCTRLGRLVLASTIQHVALTSFA